MDYLASAQARSFGRVTLACATPDGEAPGTTEPERDDLSALGGPSTAADCDVPSDFLGVSARDQTRGHYCGPAVGQVIANYTWAVPLNANKYTQAQIAVWMRTDELGGTSAFTMADGLDIATARAPRRPPNWDWVVTTLEDTDHDGTVGDQLHDYVRANISGMRMALAIPVLPHEKDGRFHLSSWPQPVNSPGHWIAAYGWRGLYDGTDYLAAVLHRLVGGRGRLDRSLLGPDATHRRHDPRPHRSGSSGDSRRDAWRRRSSPSASSGWRDARPPPHRRRR